MGIDLASIDPNIVYVGLMLSLWVGVTAAYVPGTFVVEGLAGLGLLGTLVILAQMPVNWLSVLLIVVGVSAFILVPFIDERYANFALGGLVLQVLGSMLLFHSGTTVSILLIALSVVVSLIYYEWVLMPMLRRNRELALEDRDEAVIGMMGHVTKAIDPIGAVTVDSELWTATSEEILQPGEKVMVIAREGLRLTVEKVKPKRVPDPETEEVSP